MLPLLILVGLFAYAGASIPASTPSTPLTEGPSPWQGRCGDGWVASPEIPSLCFKFVTTPAEWREARTKCEDEKSSLVSLKTSVERVWMEGQVRRLSEGSWFFRRTAYPSWWTGLHLMKPMLPWYWEDWSSTYEGGLNWQAGSPDPDAWKPCAQLQANGYVATDCFASLPFICSRAKPRDPSETTLPATTLPTTPPPPTLPIQGVTIGTESIQGTCPTGWVESVPVSDKCYHFETDIKMSWMNARRLCQSAKGDLVSIGTSLAKRWVYGQVKRLRKSMWSGLHLVPGTVQWRWTEEEQPGDIWWQAGEPNNYFERCGEIHRNGMNDNSCWRKYGFICSRNKLAVVLPTDCPFGEVRKGENCTTYEPPAVQLASQGNCSAGWAEGPFESSRCYRFVEEEQKFEDAKKMCRVARGDLITVNGEPEKAWLIAESLKLAESKGKPQWLVGLKKDGTSWKWIDSRVMDQAQVQLISYKSWYGQDCGTITPDGLVKMSCYTKKPYVCARPKVLPPNVTECAWGEAMDRGICAKYELHDHKTRVDLVNNIDISRVEDELKALTGLHAREITELKDIYDEQIANLTSRVISLETNLQEVTKRTSSQSHTRIPINLAFTVIAAHVPQIAGENPVQVAHKLISEGIGLVNIHVKHAFRIGGSPEHPGPLKIELQNRTFHQNVLHSKRHLRDNPTYKDVRIRAARLHQPNKSRVKH